jgi:hypothetical protein
MGFECFNHGRGLDLEVRGVPNSLSVSQNDDLRRLVSHTGKVREFA